MSELARWSRFWGKLEAEGNPEPVYGLLLDLYSERHRAYHTLNHLSHCLDELEDARHLANHPNEVEMALWFHDAIYDPKAKDNEARSAELARHIAKEARLPEAFGKRVRELILATRHHGAPDGADARLLVDIDLSILGRPREAFDEYETNIRKEYHFVPWPEYRSARTAILQSFSNRPAIYSTDFFRRKYESRARANLERSLGNLEAAGA
ncbi:MAG: HD domain-containing protein [Alphaproteobacteria bacterium]